MTYRVDLEARRGDGLVAMVPCGPGMLRHGPTVFAVDPASTDRPVSTLDHQAASLARLLALAYEAGREAKAAEIRMAIGAAR